MTHSNERVQFPTSIFCAILYFMSGISLALTISVPAWPIRPLIIHRDLIVESGTRPSSKSSSLAVFGGFRQFEERMSAVRSSPVDGGQSSCIAQRGSG